MFMYIPLKPTHPQLKVGPYSIFMKLAQCEIGFCQMDPCMGAQSALAQLICTRVTEEIETKQLKDK